MHLSSFPLVKIYLRLLRPIVIKGCQGMLNRELNCIRYELPTVYTCKIKVSLLKYKLKWSCNFLLLGALISSKRSEALHTSHQLPRFYQDSELFYCKIEIVPNVK